MKSLSFILFVFCAMFTANSHAQGCSDAGFCTIGHTSPALETDMPSKQKLGFLWSKGVGDESVFVSTPAIRYENQLSKHWAIQAKVTANYASGNLGKAIGLGDVYLSGIYTTKGNSTWSKSFLLATKLPLNTGNIKKDNKSLPMQYQSSLGTVDAIAGFTINNGRWLFSTAIQQPLSGRNRNGFLPAYWTKPEAIAYAPSNDFNRKGDVLLKAVYTIPSSKRFILDIGLLGIYHLGKDSYIDGNISNHPIAINGSEGTTLNGTFAASYQINKKLTVALSGGAPFVVRKIRPDGLTREFVLTPELIFNF